MIKTLPTVKVPVELYKLLFIDTSEDVANWIDKNFDDFVVPDFLCDQCGFESADFASGEPCPRCDHH